MIKFKEIIDFLEKIGAEVIHKGPAYISFKYDYGEIHISSYYEIDERKIIELIVHNSVALAKRQERFKIQQGVKDLLGI